MWRCRSSAALALALLGGCAFEDGDPWGVADLSLDVMFAPSADRLSSDGWLRTSADYEVRVDTMRLEIDGLTIRIGDDSGQAIGFDPANPPAGYSLCHNGHCHAADGRLVPYEEIAAEVGGAPSGFELRRPGSEVTVSAQPTPVTLGPCSVADCWLERGSLQTVAAEVHELALVVEVRDTRAPPRLAPTTMQTTIAVEGRIDEPVTKQDVDRTEALGLRVAARLVVPDRLFDSAELAAGIGTSTIATQLASNLTEHGRLDLTITRYDEN